MSASDRVRVIETILYMHRKLWKLGRLCMVAGRALETSGNVSLSLKPAPCAVSLRSGGGRLRAGV